MYQLLAIAGRSYREIITSRAAWMLPAIGLLLFKITPDLMEVAFFTPGRPAAARLAGMYLRFSTIGIFVGALIAFFAGQLVWRERDARAHDITDVAPVPEALTLAGKFGGLALLLVTLQAVQLVAGIASQIAAGYSNVQLGLQIGILGLKLTDYLLFAALAMAVHVVVNQKYLATALIMLAWMYSDYAGELGVEHNLLIYGSDPGLRYSDMSGFSGSLGPWLWFKLYWLGWALLFVLLARLFWVRGHEGALRARITLARRRFTRMPAIIAAVSLTVIATVGAFLFYNTNILNPYVSAADAANRSAEYERRYGQYAALPQPVVAATKLRLELHPAAGGAEIDGTYRLENRSGRAIDAIHLVTSRTVSTSAITFDRPARINLDDRDLGYRIYALAQPLMPGHSMRMSFQVRFARRGFANSGISPAITANGTFLEHRPDNGGRTWLPAVGYRRGVELDNAGDRKAHGLPPRPAMPSLDDRAARNEEAGLEHIDLETIIGTDEGQLAVAPGTLRRSWNERGRRYYHYVTDAPVRNAFPILSARYAVHRTRANGIDIEVLHDPRHTWNVDRFARAAKASLDYYAKQFGPYPYRQLRLVEFPVTGGNRMSGHPGTVVWSEVFAYAQPEADWRRIDFPFAVVAHEVAHQWWGNQLVPARVEGAPLLTESLAWYSAMQVVDETLGREQFDRTMSAMRSSYLRPHETPEVPLLRANDWLATYRTGAFAMASLRESIGAPRVNTALRNFVTEYRSARPPFPTSLDLYRHLQAVTPPATRPLLHDLFADITFWDLRLKTATAVRTGHAYRVTLTIEAYKQKVAPGGRETRVPFSEDIDLALTTPRGVTLYRLHPGPQPITLTVDTLPATATLDPSHKLLDRQPEDNVKKVSAQ